MISSSKQRAAISDSSALASILRSCSNLEQGKGIHAWMIDNGGMDRGTFFGNLLVQMFGSCGSIENAQAAFHQIHGRNFFSWKILLAAYAQNGEMTLASLLLGLMPAHDTVAWTTMITGYGKSGDLHICEKLFQEIQTREDCGVASWNAMIAAYTANGHHSERARTGKLMLLDGIRPNKSTLMNLLELSNTRKLCQCLIEETELQCDPTVGASLLRAHGRSGKLAEARAIFERIRGDKTLIAGNTMLWAYARNGCLVEAREFFEGMARRDVVSWTTLFSGWIQQQHTGDGDLCDLHRAKSVFDRMPQWNTVSWNSMLAGLGSSGEVEAAEEMFELRAGGELRDVVTWNSMITSYARHGSFSRALSLLKRMDLEGEPPNRVTWITILDCCDDLRHGRLLHHELERSLDLSSDADLSCLLIDMYGKCHSLEDACKSFEKSSTTTSVRSWTALIGAFVANGSNRRAIESFHRMALEGVHFDKVAVLSVLEACSGAGDLDRGKLLHRYAVERGWQTDVLVGTAALNMYVKCGRFEQSKLVFDALPEKSLVSWTSMVSSYAGSGRFAEALRAFKLMDLAGLGMDGVALACIFDVCAAFTALSDGSAVYSSVEASGEKLDVTAGAAAINMYGKCGDVSSAAEIFSQYRAWEWSLVLCTTMVAGFARNGHGRRAHELFELIELQGLELDVVSFTTILAACSAAGLLHDGHGYFVSMRGDYALAATMDHYVCVIDLLARSGRVDEGLALLTTMPFEPDGVSWVTVLSSCKTHGDFDVAATLAARVPASEADHPGALVTFFNLIADSSPLLG